MPDQPHIAYFSMEIALNAEMPTYAGGLGVLAADMIRSAADMGVPLVAVTLVHRQGYFHQKLDPSGKQIELPVEWKVHEHLRLLPMRASLILESRRVQVAIWRYDVVGRSGYVVPVLFLDTDLPENNEYDRRLTHRLYGGDARYRLCQEIVLGMGGIRALRALGWEQFNRYHMNEGHASLMAVELLEEEARRAGRTSITHDDVPPVRKQCVFTTHTPVPAGHDRFPLELVRNVLGAHDILRMPEVFCCDGELNMTFLALNLSRHVNGVAKRHGEVAQHMFARYKIDSITNGVHAATWTSASFQTLYDRYIPGWREDSASLRYALGIPGEQIWNTHLQAKRQMLAVVNRATGAGMERDVLTLGFARRATAYKRAALLFDDLDRLRQITRDAGPIQVVFGGKAHPRDDGGKQIIQRIFQARDALLGEVRVAYVENYDLNLAKLLTAGVDVWLNTPQPPLEASGTSGMKAALNGVPSLSILDGWWIEGCIEGITGWAIGHDGHDTTERMAAPEHSSLLYDKLEAKVIPTFYRDQGNFVDIMRHCIALNGSFFNTQRMMQEYVLKSYFA